MSGDKVERTEQGPHHRKETQAPMGSAGRPEGNEVEGHDWAASPFGPMQEWTPELRFAAQMCLQCSSACVLFWRDKLPDVACIFNQKAWQALGGNSSKVGAASSVWSADLWGFLGPVVEGIFESKQAQIVENVRLLVENRGYQEIYISLSMTPVLLSDQSVGGVYASINETTERVLSERRLRVLGQLGKISTVKTLQQACRLTTEALKASADVGFAVIYFSNDKEVQIMATTFENDAIPSYLSDLLPDRAPLREEEASAEEEESEEESEKERNAQQQQQQPTQPVTTVFTGGQPTVVTFFDDAASERSMLLLPVITSYSAVHPVAVLVVGANPYRRLDTSYREWLDLVAGQFGTVLTNSRVVEEERRQATIIFQLDQAKTRFFSHISHEFRTPLTLMLGPLEDILADPSLAPGHHDMLKMVFRNVMRLKRLVNNLLDFSAIEEGRNTGLYEQTDLPSFTRELARSFEFAADKLGLKLVIDCESYKDAKDQGAQEVEKEEPIYVARDMWEKIVLNLLSNAIKYTWEGEVKLSLRRVKGGAELVVSDTGIGIPQEYLPRIFERFFRVQNQQPQQQQQQLDSTNRSVPTRGRSHEGTGIGLPLTKELVKLHGGDLTVQSVFGQGSTFRVFIPSGCTHLPAERVFTDSGGDTPRRSAVVRYSSHFTDEALNWIGDKDDVQSVSLPIELSQQRRRRNRKKEVGATFAEDGGRTAEGEKSVVMVVDDNFDELRYVSLLLTPFFDVVTAANGAMAWRQIMKSAEDGWEAKMPELILTDVMMPVMDGFGLLKVLRGNPRTATIPVILLSARAGSEASIEGLESGADDYITKPFSAKELIAKVKGTISLSRMRRQFADNERREVEKRLLVSAILERIRSGSAGMNQIISNAVGDLSRFLRADRVVVCQLVKPPFPSSSTSSPLTTTSKVPFRCTVLCECLSEQPQSPTAESISLPPSLRGKVIEVEAEAASLYMAASATPESNGLLAECAKQFSVQGYHENMATVWCQDSIWGFISCLRRTKFRNSEKFLVQQIGEHVGLGVTKEQLIEKEIQQKIELNTAIASNKTKNMIIANTSHELRTPLNVIIGLTELLLDTHLNDEQEDMVQTVHNSSELLLGIVNDILDFSKMEADKLILHEKEFDILELLANALDLFSEASGQKEIELAQVVDIPKGQPTTLVSDPVRLRQVVINLVNNAIKFTPEGGQVAVRVGCIERPDGELHLKLEVVDTGIGISAEGRARLFQPFSQVDSSITRVYGGTGLGLAISRMLVALASGDIGVESEVGKGSTFWFTWRCHRPIIKPATIPLTPPVKKGACFKTLVVDSSGYTVLALRAMFEEIIDCHHTTSLSEAMVLIRKGQQEEKPFAAVMIYHGITNDSNELVNVVRLIKKMAPAIQVVLLTLPDHGHILKTRELSTHMGSQRIPILTKPIKKHAVELCLASLSSSGSQGAGDNNNNSFSPSTCVTEQHHYMNVQLWDQPTLHDRRKLSLHSRCKIVPLPEKVEGLLSGDKAEEQDEKGHEGHRPERILVVEDNPINVRVVLAQLRKFGFKHLDVAVHGKEALERVQHRDDYSLILMDIAMPVMDGLEATRRIRGLPNEKLQRVPIVALTASVLPSERTRCLDCGMTDFLTKPLRLKELEAMLNKWL